MGGSFLERLEVERERLMGFPGFPVKLVGVDTLHAAFLNESRTRGRVQRNVQEIRVARRFRPTYAGANMGHPSRGQASDWTAKALRSSAKGAWGNLLKTNPWLNLLNWDQRNPRTSMRTSRRKQR